MFGSRQELLIDLRALLRQLGNRGGSINPSIYDTTHIRWTSIYFDLIPILGEIILPYLLQKAERIGLVIDQASSARFFELWRIKLTYPDRQPLLHNWPPAYSWEAEGFPCKTEVLHCYTRVSYSLEAAALDLFS